MKSAIVNIIAVPTASVLSAADKSKVRVIVAAGLDLPVEIIRPDFEALYENAKEMVPRIHEFIHVRVNRNKKVEGFSIIEDEVVVDNEDNYFESLTNEATRALDDEEDNEVPFAFSEEELNDINEELDNCTEPVIESTPVEEEVQPMSALEKAMAEMMAFDSSNDNSVVTDEEVIIIEEKDPVVIDNNDDDLKFVTFVYNKAVAGKYSKWTQNITKSNLNEYAEVNNTSIEDLIEKYLNVHRNNRGVVTYYSLKTEFIVKYYDKACFASSDRKWFVVVMGGTIELYRSNGKENQLNKRVKYSESPDVYEKALKTIESYTFREGIFSK